MHQKELFDKVKEVVNANSLVKDPFKMASIIYFVLKQYPVIVCSQRGYINTIKKVKTLLSEKYDWRMVELHKLFCHLNSLMKSNELE